MGFWIFMLIMDLLIPVYNDRLRKKFLKKAPDQINYVFGYRTSMSMRIRTPGYLHIIIAERSGISVSLFFWWYL